jgi:hypothetical protein
MSDMPHVLLWAALVEAKHCLATYPVVVDMVMRNIGAGPVSGLRPVLSAQGLTAGYTGHTVDSATAGKTDRRTAPKTMANNRS